MKSTDERVKSILDKIAERKKKKAMLVKVTSLTCVAAACVAIIITIGSASPKNADIIETVAPSNPKQPTIMSYTANSLTNYNNSTSESNEHGGLVDERHSQNTAAYGRSDLSNSTIILPKKTTKNDTQDSHSLSTTKKMSSTTSKTEHITSGKKNYCIINDEYKIQPSDISTNTEPTVAKGDEPPIAKGDSVSHKLLIYDDNSYSKYMSLGLNEQFTAEIVNCYNMNPNYLNMKLDKYNCGKIYEKENKIYYTGTKHQLQTFFEKAKTDEWLRVCNFTITLKFN